MRKLRKLFKFIPLLCLPLLCGLSVFGLDHHNIKETKADDTLILVSSHNVNYDLNYTVSSATTHAPLKCKVNFYRYLDNVNKYYVEFGFNDVCLNDFSITYSGTTYQADTSGVTDNWRYTYKTPIYINNLTECFVSVNLNRCRSSGYYYSFGDYYVYGYDFLFSLNLSYALGSGGTINPSTSQFYIPYNYDMSPHETSLYVIYHASQGALLSPLDYTTSTNIDSYTIDLTYNNYELGFNDGYSSGYDNGYSVGRVNGYSSGYDDGESYGYSQGYTAGATDGYSQGYTTGYEEAENSDEVVNSIFSGILQVGFLPVEFFLAIFNFEILGINLTSVVASLLTICFTLLIIKAFKGFM